MSAHSVFGPSGAERWINCPGSVAMSAQVPKPPTSFSAAEGTVAHEIAEKLLLGGQAGHDEFEILGRVGTVVRQDGHEVTIIDEMIEGALLYKRTVEEDYLALRTNKRPAPVEQMVEKSVHAKSIDEQCWGRLDYAHYQKGNALLVNDYKFGKGKMVAARENKQLGIYAIAVMDEIGNSAFGDVTLKITQPRAVGEQVKSWLAPKEWLADLREQAKKAIALARQPGAPLKAGSWCDWCPAKAVCPEIAKKVQEETTADFALAPRVNLLPDVRTLTVEQMARALKWEDVIQSWYGDLRQHAQDLLVQGRDVPGFKLVDGRTNRKWADDSGEAAAAHFAPKFGHRVYKPKEPLTVAAMEKMVGKKEFAAVAEALVVKPQAPKKIAPDDDPRPHAATTAQEDFDPMGLPAPQAAAVDPLAEADSGDDLLLEARGPAVPVVDPLKDPMWPC